MYGIESGYILDENGSKGQLNSIICRDFALASLQERAMLKEGYQDDSKGAQQ